MSCYHDNIYDLWVHDDMWTRYGNNRHMKARWAMLCMHMMGLEWSASCGGWPDRITDLAMVALINWGIYDVMATRGPHFYL